MRSWTEQAGYPLVEIVKENDTFVITQVDTRDIVNTWWLVEQLKNYDFSETVFGSRFE